MTSGSPWSTVPEGATLQACNLCGAAIPMTQAQQAHLRWHAQQAALAGRIAGLTQRLVHLEAFAAMFTVTAADGTVLRVADQEGADLAGPDG